MTRHRAYQLRLAGHQVAETFVLTAGFLERAAVQAARARPTAPRERFLTNYMINTNRIADAALSRGLRGGR